MGRFRKAAVCAAYGLVLAVTAVCISQKTTWPAFVGLVVFGGVALLWIRRLPFSKRDVLVAAIVFRLLFIWLPPTLSDDAYRYVFDGLLQRDGINPYRYLPEEEALRPWQQHEVYSELNSASYYSVYPPTSQLYFRAAVAAASGDFFWSYVLLKGLFAITEILGLALLLRLGRPDRVILYAWSPAVIVEVSGQLHGEALLVFFLAAAIWTVQHKRFALAGAAVAGAMWVKLYPLLFVPLLLRRGRGGLRALTAFVVVATVLAAPFAAGYVFPNVRSSLDLYIRLFEFNAGPYFAVKKLFLLATGDDWSKQLGPAFRWILIGMLPVLYWLDRRHKWRFPGALAAIMGAFMLFSTTVHPWYLTGLLAVLTLTTCPGWHWYGLSLLAPGTYLLYVDGPYWTFVVVGWLVWLVGLIVDRRRQLVSAILRVRGRRKLNRIAGFLAGTKSLLDLGAGEGFVAAAARKADPSLTVQLADVVDLNQTDLPHELYDGRTLPFGDKQFDVVLLYFVLHHCADPQQVLREAVRVSRDRVVIVESTYRTQGELRLLRWLDILANRLRSRGAMRSQEEHLSFRTIESWKQTLDAEHLDVDAQRTWGSPLHRQVVFVVRD